MTKESDLIEASPQMELSIGDLRKRIVEREKKIDLECEAAVLHQARAVRLLIDQGNDLLAAKQRLKHGDWMKWLADNYPKSIQTANNYMRIAANSQRVGNFEESPSSLRDVLRALDMLPVVESEQRQLTGMELPPIFAKLASVSDWLSKSMDEVSKWDLDRRRELKQSLKPIVELWGKL